MGLSLLSVLSVILFLLIVEDLLFFSLSELSYHFCRTKEVEMGPWEVCNVGWN